MEEIERKRLEVERDKKWRVLGRRAAVFEWMPFVEVAMVAGSMAMGTARIESDFDLILGMKTRRIFTGRFFLTMILAGMGWRKRRNSQTTHNRFCLNHFVTAELYCLRPPYNVYWEELYRRLVPVYGKREEINKFLAANRWARAGEFRDDGRWRGGKRRWLKRATERVMGGRFGNWLARRLGIWQLKRIAQSAAEDMGYKPRMH